MLVLLTVGATRQPSRRRRRVRQAELDSEPAPLPLTRATAIRVFAPFGDQRDAAHWLDEATEAEETAAVLIEDGVALLNRALHVQAVAATDSRIPALRAEHAIAVRVGYGSGEETADSRFSDAREIELGAGSSRRQRREADLHSQERVGAVLGGRERLDACETLLLRARIDLDAGRRREAALQLRVGLEALLVELHAGPADPGHGDDIATLAERQSGAVGAAEAAVGGELTSAQAHDVRELLELCERVLRRRRVLRG